MFNIYLHKEIVCKTKMHRSDRVQLKEDGVFNTSSYDATSHYDKPWSKKKFKKQLKIQIVKYDKDFMEFDLIDINTAIVNALRRVLLAEVPCMAIEKAYIYNNTGVIQDEVLAHRLGLVPLKADARLFNYHRPVKREDATDSNVTTLYEEQSEANFPEDEALQFDLRIKYSKKREQTGENFVNTGIVLSKHLKWVPIGEQATKYTADEVGPVHEDIVIAKMAPGTEIDAKLFAFKGIGKDHAKFQTVGTAFYRLMPHITLLRDFRGEEAARLKSCFSAGVIETVKDEYGQSKAYVACARNDSGSRNVFRYNDLKADVLIDRVPNHFIFTIESIGIHAPNVLFLEAIKVLEDKCDTFLTELKRHVRVSS